MSDQEILTKVIQKAIAGGWTADWASKKEISVYYTGEYGGDKRYELVKVCEPERYIFNHDFAKALWGGGHYNLVTANGQKAFGSKDVLEGVTNQPVLEAWQHHLQQLVIAEDVFKYLGENI